MFNLALVSDVPSNSKPWFDSHCSGEGFVNCTSYETVKAQLFSYIGLDWKWSQPVSQPFALTTSAHPLCVMANSIQPCLNVLLCCDHHWPWLDQTRPPCCAVYSDTFNLSVWIDATEQTWVASYLCVYCAVSWSLILEHYCSGRIKRLWWSFLEQGEIKVPFDTMTVVTLWLQRCFGSCVCWEKLWLLFNIISKEITRSSRRLRIFWALRAQSNRG